MYKGFFFLQNYVLRKNSTLLFIVIIFSNVVLAQQNTSQNNQVIKKRIDTTIDILNKENFDFYYTGLSEIDSIERELIQNKDLENQVYLYIKLIAFHCDNRDVIFSKKYLDKLNPIVFKLDNKVFIGQYYELLAIHYGLKNNWTLRDKNFYLSYDYLSKYGTSSHKADMYYNLAKINVDESKWEIAIFYGKKSDSIVSNVLKHPTSIKLLLFLSDAYLHKNDLKSASIYIERAESTYPELFKAKKAKRYSIELYYHNVKGLYFELSKNQAKANEHYKKSMYYSKLYGYALIQELTDRSQLESVIFTNQIALEKKIKESELKSVNYNYQKIIIILSFVIIISLLIILIQLHKRSKFRLKANQMLQEKNEELVDAFSIKNRFFNTITHELRTPLNAINGSLYLLKSKYKNEEQETFEILDNSTSYLLKISDQIIEYNLMNEEQSNVIKSDEINLKNIIENIIHSFNTINNNQNTILLSFDEKITPFLIFDEVKITMLLNNIVDNAVKFSKNDEVKISVNLIEDVGNFQKIHFKIEDNGIGISPENLPKIFDLFFQGSDEIAITYGGSGIGLAIAKKIMDIYKSEIVVSSRLNKGTTVEFDLNFEKSISNELEKVKIDKLQSINNKIKILLVEDNKVNQIITKKILENNGYEIEIADNGFQAVEKAKQNDYSLILMDIMMPEMDGFEASKIISELKPEIPIVALTAISESVNKEKFVESKIIKVLNKPLNIEELAKAVVSYCL